jgi:tol-pal system protein YbgF
LTSATTAHDGGGRGVTPFVLLAVSLMAVGCASRSSVSRVRDDMGALRAEITELRTSHEATVRDLARVGAQSRALEARLAELSAAQSATAASIATLQERVNAAEAAAREAKMLVALPPAPRAPSGPLPTSSPAAPPAPPPLSAPATPPAPPASTPSPSAPALVVPPKDSGRRVFTPEQVYSAALATFRAREHGQAVLDFLDFIAKYPKHPLVANAQYWIGEAYYVQHDFRQAQAEFQKVLDIAPGSAKAADALLKIGYCQLNLRDTSRARATWLRVVQEFPKSEAAAKARSLLSGHHGSASIR